MNFREYRKSAVRHYITCQHLMKDISFYNSDTKNLILLNIYYLSGYVIETSLSYAYFSHIKHQGDVENSDAYTSGFKTHKFDVKIGFILKSKGDLNSIPFIHNKLQDAKLNLLFNNWCTDFRYSMNDRVKGKDLTEDLLIRYLEQVNIIMQTILKRF